MSASLAAFNDTKFAAAQAAATFLSRNVPPATERFDFGSMLQGLPGLSFEADSEIYAEGDKAVSFYKVVSGVVRTCKFLSDGRRQIDAFYGEGDVFGFEAGELHGLCAESVSDCTVIPYRRRGLETLAANDDKMALKMFAYAMDCLERSRSHALLLGRRSAMQKVAAFLQEMTSRKPAHEMIDLAMTRQDIADYLGLTIETVSRTLSQLERDGVIAFTTARRICLKDRAALRGLSA